MYILMISQLHRHKIMAYDTIRTEPAARGLVNYKMKISNEKSIWIKTIASASQSHLDELVDAQLVDDARIEEENEKTRLREIQRKWPDEAKTV